MTILITIIAICQIIMAIVSIIHLQDAHRNKILKVNFENAHDDMKMYRAKYEELLSASAQLLQNKLNEENRE